MRRRLTFPTEAQCWWKVFHKAGPVTVIHVDLRQNTGTEAAAVQWLSTEERARLHRFVVPGAGRRFALCRAALRALLCVQLDCDNEGLRFGVAEHGKPFALVNRVRAPISFNLSHSGIHGLIALAPLGRLGVDVEEYAPRQDVADLCEAVFGLHERSAVASARGNDRIRLFYRLWTIKEALIKALGLGFTFDVSQFEVPTVLFRESSGNFCFPQLPEVAWRVDYIGIEKFSAAIAHELLLDPPGDSSLHRSRSDRPRGIL